jgi:hypothetical protein
LGDGTSCLLHGHPTHLPITALGSIIGYKGYALVVVKRRLLQKNIDTK